MKKLLASPSAFLDRRVLIGILFLGCLLLEFFAFDAFPGASAIARGSRQNSKSITLHKVSIGDPNLNQALKFQGGRVIADYGSFVLLENFTSCFYCPHELIRECASLPWYNKI